MKPDLDVDASALRDCAAAVDRTSARVAAGAAQAPPATTVPRWATSDAAAALTDAAHDWLAAIAADLAATAHQLTGAADDYRAADDRAAARLRAVR